MESIYQDFSATILDMCSARIILVASGHAERVLHSAKAKLFKEISLELQGYSCSVKVDIRDQVIRRIFIIVPNPAGLLQGSAWRKAQKFSLAVRFSFTLLGLECHQHNFFENNLAVYKILRDVALENNGAPKKTSLDTSTRDWIARRGFVSEESLSELTNAAGSLTIGLLLILICRSVDSRRHASNKNQGVSATTMQQLVETHPKDVFPTRDRLLSRKFDRETLENVRELYAKYEAQVISASIKSTVSIEHETQDLSKSKDSDTESLEETTIVEPLEDECVVDTAIVEHSAEDDILEGSEELRHRKRDGKEVLFSCFQRETNEDQFEIVEQEVEPADAFSLMSTKGPRGPYQLGPLSRTKMKVTKRAAVREKMLAGIQVKTSKIGFKWQFSIRGQSISFRTQDTEFKIDALTAYVEITCPGQRHLHKFVANSTSDDKASRLAWRIQGYDAKGKWHCWYLSNSGLDFTMRETRELVNLFDHDTYEDVGEELLLPRLS